jgi:APA family basic amino acid/polyamine antiporter
MPKLKRSLSLFDATTLALGAIIGAGIFVISGIAAGLAGPAVVLSIIIAGIVSSLTAFSYTKLSFTFPEEGSIYIYAKKTISPFAGFLTGWLWVFENIVAGATVSLGLASYVVSLSPQLPLIPIASSAVLILTFLNLIGIKQSSIFNALLVLLKLSALFLFIFIGFFHLNPSFYKPFMPNGIKGVLDGAALIFFAYIGFGRPATAAEEIKNPRKTVPLSIILALTLSTIIYILVGIISVGLISYKNLATSGSPIADAVEYGIKMHWLKLFISFAAIVATLSVLLTTLIGVSRVTFAMSRDKSLPKFLNKINSKFRTPYVAIILTGLITAILPIFGSIKQIASVTNFGALFVYSMVNLSAIALFRKRIKQVFKKLVYTLISLLGLISCIALLFFLNFETWLIGITWIAIGVIYFLLQKSRKQIKLLNLF